jgi:hypothetical protein
MYQDQTVRMYHVQTPLTCCLFSTDFDGLPANSFW